MGQKIDRKLHSWDAEVRSQYKRQNAMSAIWSYISRKLLRPYFAWIEPRLLWDVVRYLIFILDEVDEKIRQIAGEILCELAAWNAFASMPRTSVY